MFKLIATKTALNLSGIISTKEMEQGVANMSKIEMLFADSYQQTRAATISVPPGSANIVSKMFMVKKK